ncbi:MAG TPA: TlpA disulfide reductase family protein [Panacibacter sp.]|nr:TlpA disulfide reductase family protein [Panacibacter sp.]
MIKSLFITILFCAPFIAFSQVKLINIDQLNNRTNHGSDTTYVINFWATWCAPCIKELDSFEKLNKQYKNEKLKVLLISVDFESKLSSLSTFIKKRNLQTEVFLINEKNEQEYINRIDSGWSGAIPATLFIKNNDRKFFEKEFTYDQLANEYKSIKSGK